MKNFFTFSIIVFHVFLFSFGCSRLHSGGAVSDNAAPSIPFDLIIRNGRIVDGTGNGWYYGDVGIGQGRIARIGNLSSQTAAVEIDARGLIVAPGFIDDHTHADEDMLSLPDAENFIRDGVTSIVAGNCGGSVVNIRQYFNDLMTTRTVLNVATLIGHNTVLEKVKGNKATPLTPDQMEAARKMVRQAMRDGAMGFSTGLIYTPGKFSPTEEIIELQKEAAREGGVYVTHMRSESLEILKAVEEALRVGREAQCRVLISHLKLPADNKIGGARALLKAVFDARAQGQEVWADQYPYTASSSGLSNLLPDWLFEQGGAGAKKILADPDKINQVLEDMRKEHEIRRPRKDFSFAVLASCRAYPEFIGKNIKEVAQIQKWRRERNAPTDSRPTPDASDSLPDVSMEEQYRTIIDIQLKGGASCVFHTQAEEDVVEIMKHPLVSTASDSGVRRPGRGQPHPRGYGSNARVLGRYVREKHVLTLEDAVRKMTSQPATVFQIRDRGMIREGYWADLTIFNPETIIDKATFDAPHQYPEGIEYVVVNGELVLEHGRLAGRHPGRPIWGPAYQQ